MMKSGAVEQTGTHRSHWRKSSGKACANDVRWWEASKSTSETEVSGERASEGAKQERKAAAPRPPADRSDEAVVVATEKRERSSLAPMRSLIGLLLGAEPALPLLLLLLMEVAWRGGSRGEERGGAGRRARSLLPRKAAALMDED